MAEPERISDEVKDALVKASVDIASGHMRELQTKLDQPLDPSRVKQRQGRGSGKFSYLETHDVKRTMNTLFGYAGWGYSIMLQDEIAAVEVEKDGRSGWHVGYRCIVRLSVVGFVDTEGSGYGDGVEYGPAARVTACELAIKESESDALKRACTKLGDQLGLGLYEKDGPDTRNQAGSERRQEGARPMPPPKSWQGKDGIRERLEKGSDNEDVWNLFMAFAKAAAIHLWGKEPKELGQTEKNIHLQKAATVTVCLMEDTEPVGPGLYIFNESAMRRCWAKVVDGHILEIPDYAPPEPERDADLDEEAERLADQAITGPEK